MPRDDFRPRYGEYLWSEMAEHLAARIASGALTGQLPGINALAADYGVSDHTARHAVAELRTRRLVFARPGLGTFVVPPEERP